MVNEELTSTEGLRSRRDEVQILDVREPDEVAQGMIEGSVHIPLNDVLAGKTEGLTAAKPVVAVCKMGSRSELAALMLQAKGFEAYNLREGLDAWNAAGLPLITPDGQPGRST